MAQKVNITRGDYNVFYPISTRWQDSDSYGRINNATCFSYFDSAVNNFLIKQCDIDLVAGDTIALVVSSGCEYLSPIVFPDKIDVGLRVDSLGRSSVHYSAALFKENTVQASAFGHFVHVFADRFSNKPEKIDEHVRKKMTKIMKPIN